MAARSKARKRAVDVLYESEIRGTEPVRTLAERLTLADPPVSDYTVELVEGVQQHLARIDDLLARYAEGWTLQRMPDVDRAVLRLGIYELLWRPDVPQAVAIDEAVELAKALSTDDSPRFVNGILARVLRERPEVEDAPAEAGGTSTPAAGAVDAAPARSGLAVEDQ